MSSTRSEVVLTESLFQELEQASSSPEQIIRILGLSEEDIAATLEIPWLTKEDRDHLGVLLIAARMKSSEPDSLGVRTGASTVPKSSFIGELTSFSQTQFELTVAVCREVIAETHVVHGLALIDLTTDDLPHESAFDIYARITALTPEEARNLRSRIFSIIAARLESPRVETFEEDTDQPSHSTVEDNAHDEPDCQRGPQRFMSRTLRRVRGRVNDALRQKIRLAAARAQDSVFERHVENAVLFSRMMPKMPVDRAVESYLDALSVPKGMSDVVYHRAFVLATQDELPAAIPIAVGAAGVPECEPA